jgi:hypothetical protein
MMVDISAIAAGAAVVAIGVKCYIGFDRRVTKNEIMIRLVLKRLGYNGDGDIDREVSAELLNRKNNKKKDGGSDG